MENHQIIKPRRPKGKGWVRLEDPPKCVTLGYDGERWCHTESMICVISAVEVVKDPHDIDKGPEYHVSISQNGHRCDSATAKWVVRQFGIDGAEEDNHVQGGIARHFWMPVAEKLIGIECPCKATEPVIKEDKGDYIWRGVPGK